MLKCLYVIMWGMSHNKVGKPQVEFFERKNSPENFASSLSCPDGFCSFVINCFRLNTLD